MYEYTTQNEKKLKENILKEFNRMRGTLYSVHELNLLETKKKTDKLFDKLRALYEDFFDELTKEIEKEINFLPKNFVGKELDTYNPFLLYVFDNEFERKKDRYAESVYALMNSGKEQGKRNTQTANSIKFMQNLNTNVRNLHKQIVEQGIELERQQRIEAEKDKGTKCLRWITAEDERVCEECGALHNVIFPINELPERPHYNCRCQFEPVDEEEIQD